MIDRMSPSELQLTPDAPWPGPAAYSERDAGFFHGRLAETVELHRLIHAEPVCVLYAQSGISKTSLLQAGVFPRLRADGWLPVRIRLDHRDVDDDGIVVPSLTAQVLSMLSQAAHACGISVPMWDSLNDSLGGAIHERGERLWGDREDEPVTPVLVFDQFEECWTQTRDRPEARAHAEALLGQIAALLDWRGLEGQVPAPVRVVFALREDQLGPLHTLRPLFPGLRRARLRLLPFTALQARSVVEQPGARLLAEGAVDAIIETFVAHDIESPVADPALLSIFCWRLNEDRRTGNSNAITAQRVFELRGEFVQQFYDGAFEALPLDQAPHARRFVESDLIDDAGFRTSAGFEHAARRYGVEPTTLDILVNLRLLHPVARSGGHSHVELVHDRIAEVAKVQRLKREEDEAKERERSKKQKLKADIAKERRGRAILIILTLVTFGALAVALLEWRNTIRFDDPQQAHPKQVDTVSQHQGVVEKTPGLTFERADQSTSAAEIIKAALESYLESLKSYDFNAQKNATPIEKSRDLSVKYEMLGDALNANGGSEKASESYLECLKLREDLGDQDSSRQSSRYDLFELHFKISKSLIKLDDAFDHAKKAHVIIKQLIVLNPSNDKWQNDEKMSREWLALLETKQLQFQTEPKVGR